MLGVDGDNLPQALFTLGVMGGQRRQPHPGMLITRLGNQHKVKHLTRFIRQSALRGEDGLP